MSSFTKFFRLVSLLLALLCSIYLSLEATNILEKVSKEIIVFTSIVCATIVASLNRSIAILSNSNVSSLSLKIIRLNRFWLSALYLSLLCAFFVIVGQATDWPLIFLGDISFGLLTFLASFTFLCIFIILFFDFYFVWQLMVNLEQKQSADTPKSAFKAPKVENKTQGKVLD